MGFPALGAVSESLTAPSALLFISDVIRLEWGVRRLKPISAL
ncbi:hypothetical protein [Pyrobaculum aerophilum]|nr:hypothetical protein [Pyrobaculum aerophilum]